MSILKLNILQKNNSMNIVEIIARLKFRELTAKEYIFYCKSFIIEIKKTFPNMYLSILDKKDKFFFFKDDLSDFNESNLYNIIIEDEEIVYCNPEKENKNLTIDSTSWLPFSSLFFLTENKNTNIHSIPDISISISQGVKTFSSPVGVTINFSESFFTKINNEILKKIFLCLENTNDLRYAVAISDIFLDSVEDKEYNLWIGNLTYFSNKNIFQLLSKGISNSDFEILTTHLGSLIVLNSIEPSEENIKKAIEIRNILGKEGLLNE